MKHRTALLRFSLLAFAVMAAPSLAAGDNDAAAKKHLLRYKFAKGEVVRTQVLHLASTETRIRGNLQSSRSRGASVKEWRFIDVAEDGSMTFEHVVTEADMSNEVTGRAKVAYNSKTHEGDETPLEYQHVADSIGKTIAVVTIKPNGEMVEQEQKYKQHSFGMGQMVFLLPEEPAAVGHEWHFPTDITVQLENGQKKRIKTRQRYKLKKVVHGLATIEVDTQVLTPVREPQIEVQLMQQLTKGVVKFDIDAGRVIHQRMEWDEEAVGFNGAQSTMQYLARFEETLLKPDPKTAAKPKSPSKGAVVGAIAGPAPAKADDEKIRTAKKP